VLETVKWVNDSPSMGLVPDPAKRKKGFPFPLIFELAGASCQAAVSRVLAGSPMRRLGEEYPLGYPLIALIRTPAPSRRRP
jgi:hypothetical protein